MNGENRKNTARVACSNCPLRDNPAFRAFTASEVDFVSHFKTGELNADAGATILVEGTHSAHLYTVLDGWGFRYKILEDGRRQILNYVVPGDMIGLQGALMEEMQHSVEALTPITLCVFERSRIFSLFEKHPGLSYDLTWIAAREESILDEHLLSIGRRSAVERAAYLLAFLQEREKYCSPSGSARGPIPVTQIHVADTLGLSIVHTNKTLRKLAARGLIRWLDRGCEVLDPAGLAAVANWHPSEPPKRPFI
ncbi:Crp/Fnr family transcriptional regulator [Rhizobium sp. RU36D]|uniref:Crp/Fnr family transcriptional regulator n=1 Tax=Rhizobium sp. RU36D TaxID=1907415 RepID=UPI0009D83A7A|nr:Crp/Fnr family transcriptional regulator [Rhizobium sp. RU36D]SMD01650.1 cAMP-binding domain of CRP or a regulatory subunit of cAMP-dependent protein kinases [Rhizobium sp. RU36D]